MRISVLLLLFLFLYSESEAQPPAGHGENLVPNPGFEELIGKRPDDDVDGSGIFRYNMVEWKSPTRSTPDVKIALPHQIKKAKRDHGIDINKPHDGYKMVGILTHNPESRRHDIYREYIQVKLKKALHKDKEYYCEFWALRDRKAKFISNNLGVVLSPTPLEGNGWDPILDVKPDYNHTELINENGRQWERISFTFTSPNRSKFLIIGNFFNNEKTKMVEAKDAPQITVDEKAYNNSYYLIDDVMLCLTAKEPEVVAAPEPEPEPAPEIEPKVGAKIKLDRVFFETAKYNLLPESNEQLNELVDLMNEYPGMEVEIHGHTDSRGGSSYNQRLSENRTRSVYNYLVENGIEASRMEYIGYGERKPIETNLTAEGRQMNRRVEFVVVKIKEGTKVEQSKEVKPYTDKS